ncbi:MAG: hypothetical protein M3456_16210, partial [Actinomycetota bacterium]|nr:hypothetical protein [Actinomycetota bacterium]
SGGDSQELKAAAVSTSHNDAMWLRGALHDVRPNHLPRFGRRHFGNASDLSCVLGPTGAHPEGRRRRKVRVE